MSLNHQIISFRINNTHTIPQLDFFMIFWFSNFLPINWNHGSKDYSWHVLGISFLNKFLGASITFNSDFLFAVKKPEKYTIMFDWVTFGRFRNIINLKQRSLNKKHWPLIFSLFFHIVLFSIISSTYHFICSLRSLGSFIYENPLLNSVLNALNTPAFV